MQLETGFIQGNAWALPRQSNKLKMQEKKKNLFHPPNINFHNFYDAFLENLEENKEKEKMKQIE